MNEIERRKREQEKKKLGLKSMYFNRYLFIRYLTAGCFFTNVYWMMFLVLNQSILTVIPLVLVVCLIPVIAEQFKLYAVHVNQTPRTKLYYWLQMGVNLCLIPTIFMPVFTNLFPFMNPSSDGRYFTLGIVLTGVLLCLAAERRLQRISLDKDKHLKRIKQYEKSLTIIDHKN